jgi:hypothetical protein
MRPQAGRFDRLGGCQGRAVNPLVGLDARDLAAGDDLPQRYAVPEIGCYPVGVLLARPGCPGNDARREHWRDPSSDGGRRRHNFQANRSCARG